MREARRPIAVFDSGVGGLTVLKALREAMPAEDFIYLGDTARLPYGTKSTESVVRYSLQCAAALASRDICCLVVACNTASASSLPAMRQRYPALPVIGVIEPGAQAAVSTSGSQHIAVIGTEGTIQGGAYQNAIRRLSPQAHVVARACSLFVALAEEGWLDGPLVEQAALRYLEPIFYPSGRLDDTRLPAATVPDTLVLGCTHFPVLAAALRSVLPPGVQLVDSAQTTAAAVLRQLPKREPAEVAPSATPPLSRGTVTWLATDGAARFARVGGIFLQEHLQTEQIEIIDL